MDNVIPFQKPGDKLIDKVVSEVTQESLNRQNQVNVSIKVPAPGTVQVVFGAEVKDLVLNPLQGLQLAEILIRKCSQALVGKLDSSLILPPGA